MMTLNDLNEFLYVEDNERANLAKLILWDQTFNTLDATRFQEFCDALSKCSNLNTLVLGDNNFETLDVTRFEIFCDALSKCHNLQTFRFSYNILSAYDVRRFQMFCEVVSKFQNLQTFDLSDNILGTLDATRFQTFCAALSKCQNLQTFYFRGNNLESLDATRFQTFFDALSKCQNLQTLDLSANNLCALDATCFQMLCDGLAKCSNLETLDLGIDELDRLDDIRFQMFCDALLTSGTVITLKHLEMMETGPRRKTLADILTHNERIIKGLPQTLTDDIPHTLASVQSIIADYALPAYERSKKPQPQANGPVLILNTSLETKIAQEPPDLKAVNERQCRADLFTMLKSPQNIDVESFKSLMKNIDISITGADNRTPLIAACEQPLIPIEIIKALLAQGADPNGSVVKYNDLKRTGRSQSMGGYDYSCVDLAMIHGREDIIKLFRENIKKPLTTETWNAAKVTLQLLSEPVLPSQAKKTPPPGGPAIALKPAEANLEVALNNNRQATERERTAGAALERAQSAAQSAEHAARCAEQFAQKAQDALISIRPSINDSLPCATKLPPPPTKR